MSFYQQPLVNYHNRYSIDPFPQIEGRYMSGLKLTPKTKQPHINNQQHHTSTQTFSIQKAKQRISYELKLAQQQNRIFEKYQIHQIPHTASKKEVDEDKAITPEKRIHTEIMDHILRVEKTKSKRMHSFMNQRRMLAQEHSSAQNSNNLNILKMLIRKKNRRSMDQGRVFCRSIDYHDRNIKIKINKEPKQFYNFTTSKSFILMEDFEKEKISLKKPQIVRNNSINKSYMTERKQFFAHKGNDASLNISDPHINGNYNQRKKKNSVDLIDDLGALSQQKQQWRDKEMSNDSIERWK